MRKSPQQHGSPPEEHNIAYPSDPESNSSEDEAQEAEAQVTAARTQALRKRQQETREMVEKALQKQREAQEEEIQKAHADRAMATQELEKKEREVEVRKREWLELLGKIHAIVTHDKNDPRLQAAQRQAETLAGELQEAITRVADLKNTIAIAEAVLNPESAAPPPLDVAVRTDLQPEGLSEEEAIRITLAKSLKIEPNYLDREGGSPLPAAAAAAPCRSVKDIVAKAAEDVKKRRVQGEELTATMEGDGIFGSEQENSPNDPSTAAADPAKGAPAKYQLPAKQLEEQLRKAELEVQIESLTEGQKVLYLQELLDMEELGGVTDDEKQRIALNTAKSSPPSTEPKHEGVDTLKDKVAMKKMAEIQAYQAKQDAKRELEKQVKAEEQREYDDLLNDGDVDDFDCDSAEEDVDPPTAEVETGKFFDHNPKEAEGIARTEKPPNAPSRNPQSPSGENIGPGANRKKDQHTP